MDRKFQSRENILLEIKNNINENNVNGNEKLVEELFELDKKNPDLIDVIASL